MNLTYAVDRLYDAGWMAWEHPDLEQLPDGRMFPSVLGVQAEFVQAGLELAIKQNLMFNCYRATWGPAGEELDDNHAPDERHGTVVGACEREAAVYALRSFARPSNLPASNSRARSSLNAQAQALARATRALLAWISAIALARSGRPPTCGSEVAAHLLRQKPLPLLKLSVFSRAFQDPTP